MLPKERVILALDTDNRDVALRWVETLGPFVGQFKVGLELVNNAGFDIFDDLSDWCIFYDAKFHDIPNTVAGAARGATREGVWMFNVHAAGGREMMEAAYDAATEAASIIQKPRPLILGVTVLSSLDTMTLRRDLGIDVEAEDLAIRLAHLVEDTGLDGVVAGGSEVERIRAEMGRDFVIMTPGVRPAGADLADQRRVLTPGEAIRKGASYIGVGRAVTRAADPVASIRAILDEVADAM